MYAHYFASKDRKELHLTTSMDLTATMLILPVSGKDEARKLAKQHNATPWNF